MAQLSREKFFRLNAASRERIYASRRATAMIAHAKRSGVLYARLLLADGIVNGQLQYRGRYNWTPADRLEMAGGAAGIRATMEHSYQVSDALLDFATRITIGLLKAGVA